MKKILVLQRNLKKNAKLVPKINLKNILRKKIDFLKIC
jgi:hypothetical protein